jgi:hypothetical protein
VVERVGHPEEEHFHGTSEAPVPDAAPNGSGGSVLT